MGCCYGNKQENDIQLELMHKNDTVQVYYIQ